MVIRKFILIMVLILSILCKNECIGTSTYSECMNLWRVTMADSKNILVTAQVLLHPASGKAINSNVLITANNLDEYAPSPETVISASKIFRANGFTVGPMVGVSFSITGEIGTFEKFFDTQIQVGKDGTHEFVINDKIIGQELSGMQLPKELHSFVAVVAFPEPFEFHP